MRMKLIVRNEKLRGMEFKGLNVLAVSMFCLNFYV